MYKHVIIFPYILSCNWKWPESCVYVIFEVNIIILFGFFV